MPLRADKWEEDLLVRSFVSIGPLIPLLKGTNNQVLFGRRGTGKTHVLMYLKSIIEKEFSDCCIFIDLRKLGSTGSIYSNESLPIKQRVARLFTDILQEIRNQIIEYLTKDQNLKETYLSEIGPHLDNLLELFGQKIIIGQATRETHYQTEKDNNKTRAFTISEVPSFSMSSTKGISSISSEGTTEAGVYDDYLDLSAVHHTLQCILDILSPNKIWVLFDEFAELNTELQVYLSDMIRRVMCPLKNCVFKIGAIEHRSCFKKQVDLQNYMGLELGADVITYSLDDFMVFSNNHAQSLMFFRDLLYQHVNTMLPSEKKYRDSNALIKEIFTQEVAFEELVLAAEGVPRDAFNIISKAILLNYNNKLSVNDIRRAAKNWYNEDKQNPIISYNNAMSLLSWIIEKVINKRHARAFLLRNDKEYALINFLYDSRILHIIKHGISSWDYPGMKFNVYSIDYGCYVDLINTVRKPLGLFEEEKEDGTTEYCQVPKEDYRSIRKAILNMDEFTSYHR